MNYIVIDLEWNQSPIGETEVDGFPFEIIEIGAVKLNHNREIIDTFHELICPQVYTDIHPKTSEIIHIDIEELQKGGLFSEVIERFLNWCGVDYCFATWGTADLMELQRNMDYYDLKPLADKPFIFYDVQKVFSIDVEGKQNPRALEYAVDYLGIEKNLVFHSAIGDAEYTARVFQRIKKEIIDNYYSLDYYHPPKTKEDEVYVIYNNYTKRISCTYDTKEALMEDNDIKYMVCCQCGRKAAKKTKWFSNNMKNYNCLAMCREHGYLKGKVRIYKTREGKSFAVKIVKLITEENAEQLRERYMQIKEKKRVRRSTRNRKKR